MRKEPGVEGRAENEVAGIESGALRHKEDKVSNWKWMAALALALGCAGAGAQTFSPPNCGAGDSDSTCFTKNYSSTCGLAPRTESTRTSCPAGYVGSMIASVTRNMCDGTTAPGASLDESGCTNCGSDLSSAELDAMMSAMAELSERVNLALMDYVCPGFNCVDGTAIANPVTGGAVGKAFRDHVWVAPDALSSGLLPTTNRVRYLASQNRIRAQMPASALLPRDANGNPITNVGALYLLAIEAATRSGLTSCGGDGKNGCSMSCARPSAGWLGDFCAAKTVQFDTCADYYAVTSPSYQPTSGLTAPYTSTSPHNYAPRAWDWPTDFGWNGLSASGGAVYLCNTTIQTCSGWQTQSSEYRCKVPASFDCSYTDPDSGGLVSATCATCDVGRGAVWDYWLTQTNSCPVQPGLSSRSSPGEARSLWQANLGSCAGAVSGGTPLACSGGQIADASGTSCVCPTGMVFDGVSCSYPPPASTATPYVPPIYTTSYGAVCSPRGYEAVTYNSGYICYNCNGCDGYSCACPGYADTEPYPCPNDPSRSFDYTSYSTCPPDGSACYTTSPPPTPNQFQCQ